MKDQHLKNLLNYERKKQINKNRQSVAFHEGKRNIFIAFEDVSRMVSVYDKWIDDDARYNFFCSQLMIITNFCKDLEKKHLNLLSEIDNDINYPSTRDTGERKLVIDCAKSALKIFDISKFSKPTL